MNKDMHLNEAKLLTIRSKMITEILLDILSEQPIQHKNLNTPIYKVSDLIDVSENSDKSVITNPQDSKSA